MDTIYQNVGKLCIWVLATYNMFIHCGNQKLVSVSIERDLGVIINVEVRLKFIRYKLDIVTGKAKHMLRLIKKSFLKI